MVYDFEHKISIKTEGKILRPIESESSKDLTSKVQKIPMNLQPHPTLPTHSKWEILWSRTNTPSQKKDEKRHQKKELISKEKLI